MKLSIGLSLDVESNTVQKWLQLDGAALLQEIELAIATGEDVVIKLAVKKEVRVVQGSVPPMARLWDRDTSNGT